MTSFRQKISAMLVLSLFLLSVVPAGLADEGKNVVDVNAEVEVKVESEENDSEVKEEVRIKTEEKDGEVKEEAEIKTEVKDGSFKNVKRIKKEVKAVQKDLRKERERLEEAKERFKEAKEDQREHRQKVLDLNKAVKRCDSDKKDCATLKVELRLGVKNHLQKSVQVVERSLEKLAKTVEKMEDLSEDEKEHALSLVADLDAELQAQKAKIDSFTSETSKEEIRAAIKDLKDLNQKVHKMQRRLVGLLVNAKLHVLVEKHAELHAQMQARIDALAAAGAEVSELEAILAEFDAKTEELKQDYEAAKQAWMEADTAGDFDQFNRGLRDGQHEVRKDLQETKKILRKFMAEYREIQRDLEGKNESEEASEESDRDETESNTTPEANASAEAAA